MADSRQIHVSPALLGARSEQQSSAWEVLIPTPCLLLCLGTSPEGWGDSGPGDEGMNTKVLN